MTDVENQSPRRTRSQKNDREELIAQKRAARVPLGKLSKSLEARVPSGYAARWVNDTGDRIYERYMAGWRFLKKVEGFDAKHEIVEGHDNLGEYVSRVVGGDGDGKGMMAYLMVIEEELYLEDRAENRRKLDQIEDQINQGRYQRGDAGEEVTKTVSMKVGVGEKAHEA